jgi:hypothetical protein
VTKQLEDFEFEATCRAVAEVARHASPDAQAALELTTYALHFLYSTDQFAAFREYLRDVKAPAHRTAHADHEFPSMTQALSWVSQSLPRSLKGPSSLQTCEVPLSGVRADGRRGMAAGPRRLPTPL